MKKFYAFAAAAMACLSMNANLYLAGDGEGINWLSTEPLEVTPEADGSYKFTVNNLQQLKISTVTTTPGDWDTFNTGVLFASLNKDNVGQAVELTPGDKDTPNIVPAWPGDWTFEIPADLSTIKATTTTPAPVGFLAIYLRGDMNNWGNDGLDETWQFKTEDGVAYSFEATGATKIISGQAFKIAAASWGAFSYGGVPEIYPSEDGEILFWDSQVNLTFADDFEGTISFNVPEESHADLTVYFIEAGSDGIEDIVAAENGAAEYFNLQGVRVNEPAAGLYLVRKAGKVEKVLVK